MDSISPLNSLRNLALVRRSCFDLVLLSSSLLLVESSAFLAVDTSDDDDDDDNGFCFCAFDLSLSLTSLFPLSICDSTVEVVFVCVVVALDFFFLLLLALLLVGALCFLLLLLPLLKRLRARNFCMDGTMAVPLPPVGATVWRNQVESSSWMSQVTGYVP